MKNLLFVFSFLPSLLMGQTSDLNQTRKENILNIMFDLNAGDQNVDMIPEVYHENVFFIDPLLGEQGLRGIEALEKYHHKLNDMTDSFEVEIVNYAIDGDDHILIWKALVSMSIKIDLGNALGRVARIIPGLDREISYSFDDIQYQGTTVFSFNPNETKVHIHRDIYNEMNMYLKMPLLGPVLKAVKEASRKNMLD